ncbi:uncharacterized protein UV8b_04746 [Ustilaginoidea virens]|uniref:ESCRT-I component n=1 Tax=Ustilaginoidea virens TaxID=1159556 RepID=A0A1B5KY57_USTVR|nr:uncharacterized protein UV8b_04746 [Ustilaginoidea virens]QUC20505.1 hypothetical protein UV8b_04746 [Ustilaginoidea virens]GAO15578.1 hypothetical protein UVI_02050110 [Ustilaginoidea virens]
MPVQQHVLNWLYSILTSEYHHVNRTYADVAQALAQWPSLTPRTDVHTFPNGSSALLLHLAGTVPVNFRGNTYRFPVSIWVPHAYPREPPLVYVTPTETMVIRPGQHVDPQGQVYHPYLVGWAHFWDKSNIQGFLSVLSDVFAKEPPVVSRQQQQPASQTPRQQASSQTLSSSSSSPPPPLPPHPQRISSTRPSHSLHSSALDSPAPPPAPPPKEHQNRQQSHAAPFSSPTAAVNHPPTSSRYDSAPPLPPQVQASPRLDHHRQPLPGPHLQQQHSAALQPRLPHVATSPGPQVVTIQQIPYQAQTLPPQHAPQWQLQHQPPPPGYLASGMTAPSQQHAQAQAAAPPPPNILDEPLTLGIPADTAVAPPPIPLNPEKDSLLQQLAHALFAIRQRSRQQNDSSMAGLQAQRNAMQQAMAGIHSESSQLTQLSNVLASNTQILHDALRKADAVVEGSASHPAPDIDELLVAPTVVSNQLYSLVAEERALGDAIFMLGRAVERGRVSPAVFAKMTRSLAREWYLKKALVRKIGQGMGMGMGMGMAS